MLIKCHRVLLLSDVSSFVRQYRELAIDSEVCFQAEAVWNAKYRVEADVIIAGGKYLKDINKNYYPSTVIILKEGESPAPYIKEGIIKTRNQIVIHKDGMNTYNPTEEMV